MTAASELPCFLGTKFGAACSTVIALKPTLFVGAMAGHSLSSLKLHAVLSLQQFCMAIG